MKAAAVLRNGMAELFAGLGRRRSRGEKQTSCRAFDCWTRRLVQETLVFADDRAFTPRPHEATMRILSILSSLLLLVLSAACADLPVRQPAKPSVSIPVLPGWFEGEVVHYVTTDVSHADVATSKGANFAPRLAYALNDGPRTPGRPSSVDKVYSVANFQQASIFASAPNPVGAASRDTAYSPLWQMVKVVWRPGKAPRTLKSEEDVLAAVDSGDVTTEVTPVVLNCAIVARGPAGALTGVLPGVKL
jgi:hypothetical protein